MLSVWKQALLSFSILLSASFPAAAVTYYINPSGNDANNGTATTSPFKTIQKAVDLAQPGDIISLASGVYLQDIITKRDGTSSQPIKVVGSASAVIKGGGKDRIFEVNHDYWQLDGFSIDGLYVATPSGASSYRDSLLFVRGIQPLNSILGFKAKNMTLKNARGECARFRYFVQSAEFAYNTVTQCGVGDFVYGGGGKNGEGIYIGTAPEQLNDGKNPTNDPDLSKGNWVHNNIFNTLGNECVDIKEAAEENIVEYNSCTGQKDPESGGFGSRGSRNIFRSNQSFGNIGAGIRLGGDTSDQGINNDIYNNEITSNAAGGIKFQRTPQGKVCSNTMSSNTGGNSVGTYGSSFSPTSVCPDAPPPGTPPTLSSFSPTYGYVGTSVTITGANLGSITKIQFGGGAPASFVVNSDSNLVAIVPPGSLPGSISITNSVDSMYSSKKFALKPSISSFTPTIGAGGTVVTINGEAFVDVTSVRFDGIKASSWTVVSPNQIRATLPTNPSSGYIKVQSIFGTGQSTVYFTVP